MNLQAKQAYYVETETNYRSWDYFTMTLEELLTLGQHLSSDMPFHDRAVTPVFDDVPCEIERLEITIPRSKLNDRQIVRGVKWVAGSIYNFSPYTNFRVFEFASDYLIFTKDADRARDVITKHTGNKQYAALHHLEMHIVDMVMLYRKWENVDTRLGFLQRQKARMGIDSFTARAEYPKEYEQYVIEKAGLS